MNYTQTISGSMAPTANLTVKKSRLRVYKNVGELPIYYLQKGTEFEIEIFNPTTHTILAKISLNENPISQGGLVLKPGERIFLDRYLDVAKKFMFDTYEVGSSDAVKQAIANNGDFKVQFFRERQPNLYLNINTGLSGMGILRGNTYNPHISTTGSGYLTNTNLTTTTSYSTNSTNSSPSTFTNSNYCSTVSSGQPTLDWIGQDFSREVELSEPRTIKSTIETGRVEKGSESTQKIVSIDLTFEYSAFHTVEYKMLPLSQKINTSEDINIKRYCNGCGAKLGKGHKFCSSCGNKI